MYRRSKLASSPPVVTAVVPGGQASSLGVRPGWTIIAVNGRVVSSPGEMLAEVQATRSNYAVWLVFVVIFSFGVFPSSLCVVPRQFLSGLQRHR